MNEYNTFAKFDLAHGILHALMVDMDGPTPCRGADAEQIEAWINYANTYITMLEGLIKDMKWRAGA